jgi:signal transduction histidine kinase
MVEMRSLLADAAGPFGEDAVVAIESDDGEVRCDAVRVRQVLTNLIANATRSMPGGGTIRIEARRRDDGWTVVVADQGRGIDPNDLERVFDRFVKSADSPGSGLGLSIARDLVVAHGGIMTARSMIGEGTEIEFTLP